MPIKITFYIQVNGYEISNVLKGENVHVLIKAGHLSRPAFFIKKSLSVQKAVSSIRVDQSPGYLKF